MPGPAQPATSSVGALLRLIAQEKSKAPHLQTPQAASGTPIRAAAGSPLESPILPESPGSERTVGVKPELLPGVSEAGIAADTAPGRTNIGAIGGPEGGIPGVGSVPAPPVAPPQEPKRQPTLAEYRAQGKTVAQWYAETGQQSTLDALGADPRTDVNMETGEITKVGEGRHPSRLRTLDGGGGKTQPSLQDYLNQGKTAAQWYAETGRQGELDKLGGPDNLKPLPAPKTASVTPTSGFQQPLRPSGTPSPAPAPSDQGGGSSGFIGPIALPQGSANAVAGLGDTRDDLVRKREELREIVETLEFNASQPPLNLSPEEQKRSDDLIQRLRNYVRNQ